MAKKNHATIRAGKAPSQRMLRVGEELRHALAGVLQRGDFHDPDLQGHLITVSEVRISPDLKNATAFVSPLGGGDMDGMLAALRRAGPFLRGQIVRAVNLRHAPTLSFEPDVSFEYAGRIDAILHSPDVARDLEPRRGPRDTDEEDDSWDEKDEEGADDLGYEEADDIDDAFEEGEPRDDVHDEPSTPSNGSGRGGRGA
ncbi:30S ribosome-binding factor RbfA [Azospirillum sp. sgz301742]